MSDKYRGSFGMQDGSASNLEGQDRSVIMFILQSTHNPKANTVNVESVSFNETLLCLNAPSSVSSKIPTETSALIILAAHPHKILSHLIQVQTYLWEVHLPQFGQPTLGRSTAFRGLLQALQWSSYQPLFLELHALGPILIQKLFSLHSLNYLLPAQSSIATYLAALKQIQVLWQRWAAPFYPSTKATTLRCCSEAIR